jgi:type II secretory pathway predicted ATPase ExeA
VVSKVQTRQGLSLVYGAAGTDKTTVARWLRDQHNDDSNGLSRAHPLYNAVDEDRTAVLIIDEANLLPAALLELLRQLLNFVNDEFKLLQLVLVGLVGTGDLRAEVRRKTALAGRARSVSTLEPFDEEELGRMLAYRLSVAGRAPPVHARRLVRALPFRRWCAPRGHHTMRVLHSDRLRHGGPPGG